MTHNRELPKDWHWTTIGAVCQINPPKPNLRGFLDKTTVLFVPMAAVDEASGQVSAAEARSLGEVRKKSYRTFTSGDVLFAKITPCMENGKSAVAPQIDTGLGFGSTEFHVIRTGPSIDRKYLWHFVRQETFRRKAEQNMTGSVGQLRVPKEFIERSPILLPPLEAQRALIENLDLVTAKSSSARLHLAAARRAIERFRQAVLAAACSGRLTADWRAKHPNTRHNESTHREVAAKSNRRPPREQAIDLPLPEIPASYLATSVGRASVRLEYGTSMKATASANTGIPVLRMGNIQNGQLELHDLKYCVSDCEIKRLLLQDGDLLFNRTNSPELVGKSAVFHEAKAMTFASYLIRVRFPPEVALPDFVNYWLNSAWGRTWARLAKTDGVSQSNINGSKLSLMPLPLPLPPIEEQRVIVERASQMLKEAERIARSIEAAAKGVDQSSQAILAKAFRGELVPNGATTADGLD